jgi:hypothetical protein
VRHARIVLIVPLLLVANVLARPVAGQPSARSAPGALPTIEAAARSAGFTYGPSVTPADRAAIEAAVAGARPEAQRLIGIVDGLTTLDVGSAQGGAAGTATDLGDRYEVVLDLATVTRMGPRAVSRLVLHELAHVVDYALVKDELLVALDAQVPPGYVCEAGRVGSCAPKEERFAETFAKWATGDIGVDIYLGYKVLPPNVPLDDWGAPLSGLGA